MLYRYIDLSILCDFGSYDQSVSKSPTLSVLQKPISKSFYCTRRTTQKIKIKRDRGENEENSVLKAYSNIHCIYEEGGD